MNVHLAAPAIVITPRYISARGLYSNAHNACVCSRYSGDIGQVTVKCSLQGVFGTPAKLQMPSTKKKKKEEGTTKTGSDLQEEELR